MPLLKKRNGLGSFYLLTAENQGPWRQLASSEVYHFCMGDPVELLTVNPLGETSSVVLGSCQCSGMKMQHTVPAGHWQYLKIRSGSQMALLGTDCHPNCELVSDNMDGLMRRFPQHAHWLRTTA